MLTVLLLASLVIIFVVNSCLITLQIYLLFFFKLHLFPFCKQLALACLLKRCLIHTRCLAVCLDTCIMNFQSSHPTPHAVTCWYHRDPAPTAHSYTVVNTWITVQVSCMWSCRSLEISAHFFYFPGTQTDQATTDTVCYGVLMIWQKNETGKFSIAGNNDEALLLSIFLPTTEGSPCEAGKLPLIPTRMKTKVGEKG